MSKADIESFSDELHTLISKKMQDGLLVAEVVGCLEVQKAFILKVTFDKFEKS